MGTNSPIEPSAAMRGLASITFDMYNALLNEGFTPEQALHLTSAFMGASVQASSMRFGDDDV